MLKKMSMIWMMSLSTLLCLGSIHAEDATAKATIKESEDIDMKKVSEAFGNFIGRNLKSPGVDFDLESIIKGMRDGADGKPSPLSDQEYEISMIKLQERAFNKQSDENLKAGEAFLSKNATETGVQVLVPGKLQYKVEKEGTGAVVPEAGSPSIKYTAKYIDGTVFDSSEAAGGAVTIPLAQTIPGFSKGIAGMKEGEKRLLFVHPDLGYGKSGQLPPNSTLIFEVEVVKATGDHKDLDADADEDDDFDDHEDDKDHKKK